MNYMTTIFTVALVVYLFGVWMGIWTERQKKDRMSWSSKYWWDCPDCWDEFPGVVTKIGANTELHLEQLREWHYYDMHKED